MAMMVELPKQPKHNGGGEKGGNLKEIPHFYHIFSISSTQKSWEYVVLHHTYNLLQVFRGRRGGEMRKGETDPSERDWHTRTGRLHVMVTKLSRLGIVPGSA